MVDVGPLESFPADGVRIVRAGRHSIGVVRWRGSLFAVRNVCPHQGGPACEGRFGPRLIADARAPQRLEVEEEVPVVSCAWHGWEFDARSGRSLFDPAYKVRTWPVRVSEGRVLIDLEGAPVRG